MWPHLPGLQLALPLSSFLAGTLQARSGPLPMELIFVPLLRLCGRHGLAQRALVVLAEQQLSL